MITSRSSFPGFVLLLLLFGVSSSTFNLITIYTQNSVFSYLLYSINTHRIERQRRSTNSVRLRLLGIFQMRIDSLFSQCVHLIKFFFRVALSYFVVPVIFLFLFYFFIFAFALLLRFFVTFFRLFFSFFFSYVS